MRDAAGDHARSSRCRAGEDQDRTPVGHGRLTLLQLRESRFTGPRRMRSRSRRSRIRPAKVSWLGSVGLTRSARTVGSEFLRSLRNPTGLNANRPRKARTAANPHRHPMNSPFPTFLLALCRPLQHLRNHPGKWGCRPKLQPGKWIQETPSRTSRPARPIWWNSGRHGAGPASVHPHLNEIFQNSRARVWWSRTRTSGRTTEPRQAVS